MIDKAFTAIFDAMLAWHQIMFVLAGLFLLLIGGLILAHIVYSRLTGMKVDGRLVAVRVTGSPITETSQDTTLEQPEEPSWARFAEALCKAPGTGTLALLLALIVVGVPLLFVGIGAYLAFDYIHLTVNGIAVTGTVTDSEYTSSAKGGRYYATIAFKDQSGTTWKLRDNFGRASSTAFKRGTKVAVRYAAADPEHFIAGGFRHNMLLPVSFMGMGGLCLFFLFARPHLKNRNNISRKPRRGSYAGEMYYPVYEYMARDGAVIRAESGSGSNRLADKIPDATATLYVRPDDPEDVSVQGFLPVVMVVIFAIPGSILLYTGLTRFAFNIFTAIISVAVLAWLGYKARLVIKPRDQRDSTAGFRQKRREKRRQKRAEGRLLSMQEIRQRLRVQDRQVRLWTPCVMLVAAALIAGGVYLGQDITVFLSGARKAQGEVVRMDRVRRTAADGSRSTYYPVVSFGIEAGDRVEFKDRVGSSSPGYRAGDAVTVLYDPEKPTYAIIDRGIWHWAASGGCLLAGLLVMFATLKSYAGVRARQTPL